MGGACSRRLSRREYVESPDCSAPARREVGLCRVAKWQPAVEECQGSGANSLLDICVAQIAQNLEEYPTLDVLPRDLIQRIFTDLVTNGTLTLDRLPAFHGCSLQDLSLPSLPAVTDAWLDILGLHYASLLSVDVSRCTQLSSEGLLYLRSPAVLESLAFDNCQRIDDAALELLLECGRLRRLSCQGCHRITAKGMEPFQALRCLTDLDMERCAKIGGGLIHIKGLAQLKRLNLGWCNSVGDADMEALAHLSQLEELHLSRSKVTDEGVAHLRGLSRLKVLAVAGCPLTDTCMPSIGKLTNLTSLNMEWCNRISSAGLQHLDALRSLRSLNVAYSKVAAGLAALQGLLRLEELNLDSTSVGNEEMQYLAGLKNLRSLDLSDTSVGDPGLRDLQGLSRLSSLNVSYSHVTDAGMAAVGRMPSLTALNIDSRNITDAGLARLTALTGLTVLDMFGAKVTDVGAAHLRTMKQLRALELCGGGLTDAGVQQLRGLTALTSLNLSQNQRVTDVGLACLSGMAGLETLNISGCSVTGGGLLHLCRLSRLTSLALHSCQVSRSHLHKLHASSHCRWPPNLTVTGLNN